MSSIVLDLQQELISGNCDVMSALRKAHLIASNLHLTEFDAWVQSELNGYDSYESIPEYRVASGILKANDHFRGWTTVVIQDAKTEKAICERRLGDSIGDIIELSKHVTGTAEEQRDEKAAQEISEAHHERLSAFAFSKCNIPVGAEIEFSCRGNQNSGTVCTVADDKHVKYNGEIWSLTGLAKHLLGTHGSIPGPKYFKYQGEWLSDIRRRIEGRD